MRTSICTIFFVPLAWIALPAYAEPPSPEIKAVTSEVLSNVSWRGESKKCPSEFVQPRESLDHIEKNECRAGYLRSCLEKCKAEVPGACYWLGQAIAGADESQEAAEALYQRSCKLGVMSGCTNRAAGMLQEKPADASTEVCASQTFSKACAFDDPWACTMYAFQLSRGSGVKRDVPLALKVLNKSCRYGPEDEACVYGKRLRKELLQDAALRK